MLDLSIIVPIYNVAAYLPRCVDSLLRQDLLCDRYEVMLVDDGSTDDSGKIADEYAGLHENIRVIHQANAGLSEARNAGIDNTTGKYVMFVDSDDYLEPNVLAAIVAKMKEDNLDILRFNYQNVNEAGQVFNPNKTSKPFVDYRDEICTGEVFLTERLGSACYAWQFALSRELTRIRFMRGRYFEDMLWTPQILLAAKRVTSTSMMVYNYLCRQDSITKSKDIAKIRKRLEDILFVMQQYRLLTSDLESDKWFESCISESALTIIYYVSKNFYNERNLYINRISELAKFPLRDYYATDNTRRKLLIANLLGLRFCCFIMHYI